MGNSSASFPYTIVAPIEHAGSEHWALSLGIPSNKTDANSSHCEVCIFKFAKSQKDKLKLGQHHYQKLRTLKHPFILSCIDGVDLPDALISVTEYCTPLSNWLAIQMKSVDEEMFTRNVIWGLKCICTSLSFLHDTCSSVHGNVGTAAIFVTRNGDWKLGSFDLIINTGNMEDVDFFKENLRFLKLSHNAPEMKDTYNGMHTNLRGYTAATDIYALGECIKGCFDKSNVNTPSTVLRLLQKMMSIDSSKRPSTGEMLRNTLFRNEDIKLLCQIDEMLLNSQHDSMDILKSILNNLPRIPKETINYKIIPNLAIILDLSIKDFLKKEARENCRIIIDLCISLLSNICKGCDNVDLKFFSVTMDPVLISLWSMSDREIRLSLLASLKTMNTLVSSEVLNNNIIDPLLSGFTDSNFKIREETLKSLFYIVNNINEKNFNEKIIRFITGLQNDDEASIRTNAIIFLGKVSSLLRENVRNTALISAFIKAMRDNFKPCRVAALKATKLTTASINPVQLATKLLPQICLLFVDPSSDVRNLAIAVMENCIDLISKHNSTLPEDPTVVTDSTPNTPPRISSGSSFSLAVKDSDTLNKVDISVMASSSKSISRVEKEISGLKLDGKTSRQQLSGKNSSWTSDEMDNNSKGWDDDLEISDDEPSTPSKVGRMKNDLQKVKRAAPVAKKLEKTSFDNWDDF